MDISFITIDLDDLDLDDETRALLLDAMPTGGVGIADIITEELASEMMVTLGMVQTH